MDRNELKTQVATLVDDLFNEKEEAEIRRKTEVELEKAASTISELTSTLEEKNAEVAELAEKISEMEANSTELESELEAAKKELEEATTKLAESEQTLEDMRKDRAAELRMAELEDAGVARSDRESQMAKVREMTEEDFASYKDELVSIREAVVAELEKASKQQAEADAKAEEEAAAKKAAEEAKEASEKEEAEEEESEEASEEEESEEAAEEEESEEASEEEDETTAPAQITPGQAAQASLNMEYRPSEKVMDKYRALGEAMANKMKSKKSE